jgi:hypothetical protein
MSLIKAKTSGLIYRIGDDSDDEDEYNEEYNKHKIKINKKKKFFKTNYCSIIVSKFIKIIDKFV